MDAGPYFESNMSLGQAPRAPGCMISLPASATIAVSGVLFGGTDRKGPVTAVNSEMGSTEQAGSLPEPSAAHEDQNATCRLGDSIHLKS